MTQRRATTGVAENGAPCALIVSSDTPRSLELTGELRSRGVCPLEARSSEEAARVLSRAAIDLVFCDAGVDSGSGLSLLASVRERYPRIGRVLVSDLEAGVRLRDAINEAGVHYLLPARWDPSSLEAALAAAGSAADEGPVAAPPRAGQASPAIIGESAAIRELLELVSVVGPTNSTVLVTGETGSGKELIGRAVHEASDRRDRTFCEVNSAAFPETLLESELFGHLRGSFTGATSNKKGLFEQADRGTVFLDEVAEMPLSMQAKLLRFLQTGEIRPIGSTTTRFVDVRLVAATNKDLVREVKEGRFREDLYYRLNVIPLYVPPLRDRVSDIPLLARHFLERLARRSGQTAPLLEGEALEALLAYDWPGNVRELQNVMERAMALCRDGRIGLSVLPRFGRPLRTERALEGPVESLPVLERRHIIETLDRVGWNKKRAAELLEISTTTLWRRLKEFGVDATSARPHFDPHGVERSSIAKR